MPTDLRRDLGLAATIAIAMGAMLGTGIFILPGIAYAEAGTAVVLAYVIAGLIVLPAVLSAAEMATALPEDGGSYVYVERGMGPILGTVAGFGNWFMLSFKGALVLVGGVPYLVFVSPGLAEYIVPIAVFLAVVFTVINIVSTKSTGSVQIAIVALTVIAVGYVLAVGAQAIDVEQTTGTFDITSEGLLVATGIVLVSYAGVIKIAAVAEEVKDPGKTIPRAMIGSLLLTTIIYVAVVYFAIGSAPDLSPGGGFVSQAGEGVASLAHVAAATHGEIGVIVVVFAAILALASTANAGLLSASRFPFAMARDGLAPPYFELLSERYKTPAVAVAITGAAMILMVVTLPIEELAKFGSAFQILVFFLVNLSVIGFREGAVEGYDPDFVAPLYPWMQLFGMIGGVVILSQMGTLPLLGAIAISLLAIGWYFVYARPRVEREGAARAGVRENVRWRAVDRTRELFETEEKHDVLVAITEDTSLEARRDMIRMATDMGRLRSTIVSVVEFVEVPHRIFAGAHPEIQTSDIPDWLPADPADAPAWFPDGKAVTPPTRTSGGVNVVSPRDSSIPETAIEFRRIVSEDPLGSIVDVATYGGFDLIVAERREADFHRRIFGRGIDWLLRNAPCDVVLVEDDAFDGADKIAVVANRGPFDPLKLLFADAVAEETGAEINLLQAIPEDAPASQRASIERYHEELISILTVPTRSTIIETHDEVNGLARFVGDADLLVTGVDRTGLFARVLGRPGNRLVDSVDITAAMVQTHDGRKPGFLQRLLMNHVFG